MILRFLNVQGIAGLAVGLTLSILLAVQKIETAHWKKQSTSFEQLYRQEQSVFAKTVANTRAAATQARAADLANASRVAAEQSAINERTQHDFEARLAAARNTAQRLQLSAQAASDPRARRDPSVSPVSAATESAAQPAGQDRLSPTDSLTATEQAIQLDELIKWVKAQATIDPSAAAAGEAAQ